MMTPLSFFEGSAGDDDAAPSLPFDAYGARELPRRFYLGYSPNFARERHDNIALTFSDM